MPNMLGIYNLIEQIKNIGTEIQNIGNKLDMKKRQMEIQNNLNNNVLINNNNIPMNQNMMNIMMMSNNFMNNMNQNIIENDIDSKNIWNLFFEDPNGRIISVVISNEKTVQEAINTYRKKANNNKKNLRFIYNNKDIIPQMKILESGMNNWSHITVIEPRNVLGSSETGIAKQTESKIKKYLEIENNIEK
jgi:hypothetical protein